MGFPIFSLKRFDKKFGFSLKMGFAFIENVRSLNLMIINSSINLIIENRGRWQGSFKIGVPKFFHFKYQFEVSIAYPAK